MGTRLSSGRPEGLGQVGGMFALEILLGLCESTLQLDKTQKTGEGFEYDDLAESLLTLINRVFGSGVKYQQLIFRKTTTHLT